MKRMLTLCTAVLAVALISGCYTTRPVSQGGAPMQTMASKKPETCKKNAPDECAPIMVDPRCRYDPATHTVTDCSPDVTPDVLVIQGSGPFVVWTNSDPANPITNITFSPNDLEDCGSFGKGGWRCKVKRNTGNVIKYTVTVNGTWTADPYIVND